MSTVTKAAVRVEVHETLDTHGDLLTKVSFNRATNRNDLTNTSNLGLSQLVHASIPRNASLFEDLLSDRGADAKDVGERDFDPLITGNVYA